MQVAELARRSTTAPERSMRSLLLIAPSLGGGGAKPGMLTVLRYLDRSNSKLTLAVVDGRGARYLQELAPDVEYVDLGFTRVRYAAPALLRLIWKRRPDVVLSTVGHLNLSLALLKPFLPRGTRLIARETSVLDHALQDNPVDRAFRVAYRRVYRRF